MKVKSMKYFPLKAIKAQNIFEFLSMEDLTQFAEFHQLKEIFILQNSEATSDHFAVMHHNNLLQHATEGFATVDDYLVAKNKSFPDANSYYEAIKSGYDSYENYYMVKEAGIKDKEEFDKIQQGGFIAGFKNDWQDQPDTTSLPQQINNAFELYQYAINRGFDTFSNFWDALQKGFENRDIYDIAREYGFDNAADYEEAKAKGFQLYEHLQLARNLKARDQEDLIRMNNIVSVNCTDCGMDERLMLVLLSKIEQGKRVSINKLMDLLEKSINEYRYADTGEMPEWFKRVFDGRESIISFLQINIEVKK